MTTNIGGGDRICREPHVQVGVYIDAVNSNNCIGQLLSYPIGPAIANTSMGYKLPVQV